MIRFRQYIYAGDRGRDVKAVKRVLVRAGHHEVNDRTDLAGKGFSKALRAYQRHNKVKVDGIYGLKTHEKLSRNFTLYERWLYRSAKKRDPWRQKKALLVGFAKWGIKNNAAIHYSEGPDRGEWLSKPAKALPMTTDCSGFVTACYKWAGLSDPNGLDYRQLGYTGTLLEHAYKYGKVLTDVSKARVGDLIVFGPGTGLHVVMVIGEGADPLVVSHGSEPGPLSEHVSYDQRYPRRVLRYMN